MSRDRLDLGKWGEETALKEIKRLGYKCLERNFRCPLGEVDLIARDGDCLVFLEIKTRRGRSSGYAKEAVDARKQRQLSKAALFYMKQNGCSGASARFDVVAVTLKGGETFVEIVKDAFDLAY